MCNNKTKSMKFQKCQVGCGRTFYIKPRDRKKFTDCPFCQPKPEFKRCLRCDQWFYSSIYYVCYDCKSSKGWRDSTYAASLSSSSPNFEFFNDFDSEVENVEQD